MRGSIAYKKRWSFLVPQPYFDPRKSSFQLFDKEINNPCHTKKVTLDQNPIHVIVTNENSITSCKNGKGLAKKNYLHSLPPCDIIATYTSLVTNLVTPFFKLRLITQMSYWFTSKDRCFVLVFKFVIHLMMMDSCLAPTNVL